MMLPFVVVGAGGGYDRRIVIASDYGYNDIRIVPSFFVSFVLILFDCQLVLNIYKFNLQFDEQFTSSIALNL